jgi:hypothetical protein
MPKYNIPMFYVGSSNKNFLSARYASAVNVVCTDVDTFITKQKNCFCQSCSMSVTDMVCY